MSELSVLVIDDEPGMCSGVERTLRNFKFQIPEFSEEVSFKVSTAGTGTEGMAMIMAEKPDILVLDHKLPDIQGLDILVDLAQKKLDILTIMVTAFASLEVAISATRNGAFDFLAKPFTPDELRSIIQKAAKQVFLHHKALRLAEERKHVRFQFISVLAHELKSPIAAVEGYLRVAEQHMLGEEIALYDTIVKRSLRRLNGMQKMILDLLDLTRIESGKMNRTVADMDVVELARESMDGVLQDARDRNITLSLEAPETLPFTADRGELEIILNNFMTNAVKYNRDGGKVVVTLAREGTALSLVFADSGIGMSDDEQKRLFGEFVRMKNENTKDIMGSGLGLSIVKKLITFYGGSVDVRSEKDVGTTFTVRLNEVKEAEKP